MEENENIQLIDLYRNSSSHVDGDILGRLVFNGENDELDEKN